MFLAPTDDPIPLRETALPVAYAKNEDLHYIIHGGTRKNAYILGRQKATIHMGAGTNVIQLSLEEDLSRTVIVHGYRDDASCVIELKGMTISSDCFSKAELAIRKSSTSFSDLILKFGKTNIEIHSTDIKKVQITADDGTIFLAAGLFMERIAHNGDNFSYKNLKDYAVYFLKTDEPKKVVDNVKNDIFSGISYDHQKDDDHFNETEPFKPYVLNYSASDLLTMDL